MDETPSLPAESTSWHMAGRLLVTVFLGILIAIPLVYFTFLVAWNFVAPWDPSNLAPFPDPFGMILLLVLTPIAILLGWRGFSRNLSVHAEGLLAGLTFGLWSLSCAICIPYLGMYPSVWALYIHALIFGWENNGTSFWPTLYVLNLVVGPVVGLVFFQRMARWRQRLDLQV